MEFSKKAEQSLVIRHKEWPEKYDDHQPFNMQLPLFILLSLHSNGSSSLKTILILPFTYPKETIINLVQSEDDIPLVPWIPHAGQ